MSEEGVDLEVSCLVNVFLHEFSEVSSCHFELAFVVGAVLIEDLVPGHLGVNNDFLYPRDYVLD